MRDGVWNALKTGDEYDSQAIFHANGLSDLDRHNQRTAGIKPLAERMVANKPEKVIVVMKGIEAEVAQACLIAHLNSPDLKLPFPGRPAHHQVFVRDLADFLRRLL